MQTHKCYAVLYHHPTFFTILLEDKENPNPSWHEQEFLLAAMTLKMVQICKAQHQESGCQHQHWDGTD